MSKQGKYQMMPAAPKPEKRKSKSRLLLSLMMSLMSMLLCTSMLMSTTLAWFTDSVTVTGNQIITGTLEVKVELLDANEQWQELTDDPSSPKVFDGTVNWAPGHTEIRNLKISNMGNLDILYILNLTLDSGETTVADAFDVYLYTNTDNEGKNQYGLQKNIDFTDLTGWTSAAKLSSFCGSSPVQENLAGAENEPYQDHIISIAVQMREDATRNEYQGKTLEMSLKLNAYQHDIPDDEITNPTKYVAPESPDAFTAALKGTDTKLNVTLADNTEYIMPSVTSSKTITISGTKDAVLDLTLGAYMDDSTVTIEGVTIKGGLGMANGNGSDYAALYTPNVTYRDCTFDGPFRIGRDGATFINCTFKNLYDGNGSNYVWTYGNDCSFYNCTFESQGKALLIYSDGGTDVAQVKVENCIFNATAGAKAGAIANQNCAAIEIDNYGNGVNLTLSGNEYDENHFSGQWRIKTYDSSKPSVTVNGVEYTSIALDGKTMTIDANKNVTVSE